MLYIMAGYAIRFFPDLVKWSQQIWTDYTYLIIGMAVWWFVLYARWCAARTLSLFAPAHPLPLTHGARAALVPVLTGYHSLLFTLQRAGV